MAREATSAHLDSMIHVYNGGPLDGTTARLYVTPWDRNTVADGYWQTVNTIQPLINRDIYLADAIDKLAEKHTVYNPGFAISIDPVSQSEDIYKISVNREDIFDSPSYNFDSRYFTYDVVENTATVGLKIDDNFISATDDGIVCNIDNLLYETRDTITYSALTAHTVSSFTYKYSTDTKPLVIGESLPHSIYENTIYCIG